MKGKFLKSFLISCFIALSVVTADAAPKITASIDSTVIEMGSYANITIDIADPAVNGHIVDLPEAGSENDIFDCVKVECDTFPAGFQYRLQIQAFTPGDYTFEPFMYAYGNDTARSGYLSLKVLPVDLDSLQTINPMTSVVNVPRRWYDYIPDYIVWIILAAALLAVAITLYMLYRKNGTIIVRHEKPIDPYEEAMSNLNSLRQRKLAESGQEKEFYTALVDILRKYLERRFSINAMEMSSTQILQTLRKNPETRDNQPKIKQILEIADFVKFANVRPMPDDNIKTFNNVVSFVEDTKPVPVEDQADNNGDTPESNHNK